MDGRCGEAAAADIGRRAGAAGCGGHDAGAAGSAAGIRSELAESREELQKLRLEMAAERERAAKAKAVEMKREQEHMQEAAQRARGQDVAVEEYIMRLVSQIEERAHGGAQQHSQQQEAGDSRGSAGIAWAHRRRSPSPPPSPPTRQAEPARVCPHCHAHSSPVSLNGRAVDLASSQPRQPESQRSPAASPGALAGSALKHMPSTARERERRAEWAQNVLDGDAFSTSMISL